MSKLRVCRERGERDLLPYNGLRFLVIYEIFSTCRLGVLFNGKIFKDNSWTHCRKWFFSLRHGSSILHVLSTKSTVKV